jgi:putative nucleotidyltransferase with HDIG domain
MKRRILFVDDEQKILQGLRRMLRNMRHEWEMQFAESGQAALEILDREPFDVVVSDMRMPGMDGSELLSHVKQRYPMILRIVLSGHSDHEMILKSVCTAHQFLSKPCDSEMLKSTVSRLCTLRDFLGLESLKKVVSGIDSLPSLPCLYMEIMEELQSSDVSIEKVGKIIEKDLSMTAKILQLVNSSFFGMPRHISEPSQAVILLGLDTVRSLVLAIGLFSQFDQATLSSMHVQNIYEHSMKTGSISRIIAKMENMGKELVDNAFMAGLLHDLGKLVCAANFPEVYREVFKLSGHGEMAFHEVEMEKLGATHAQVGGYLLGLWGLPETIVEGVAFHHNPRNCPAQGFVPLTAVYTANILEHHTDVNAEKEDPWHNFDAEYFGILGLEERIPLWRKASEEIECEAN